MAPVSNGHPEPEFTVQNLEGEVVQGVEDAENGGVAEVITREVLEDDVPDEYLNDEGKNAA